MKEGEENNNVGWKKTTKKPSTNSWYGTYLKGH
jgi:hypothetical protein